MIFSAFTPLLEFFILCGTNWASPESKTTSLTLSGSLSEQEDSLYILYYCGIGSAIFASCHHYPASRGFFPAWLLAFTVARQSRSWFFLRKQTKTRLTGRQMNGWRMVFASIRERAEHCDFFASTSRNKKICFASSEHFREYNSRAATSSIFRLQQSIWKSFSLK